jgi:hypothetical protein
LHCSGGILRPLAGEEGMLVAGGGSWRALVTGGGGGGWWRMELWDGWVVDRLVGGNGGNGGKRSRLLAARWKAT